MASSSKRPKKLEVKGSKSPLPTGAEQLISKWFADEKTQDYYFEWYAGRRIIPPKTLKLEWFKNEGFSFPPLLAHQELGKFLELEGPYYPEFIRLFLCFASSNEGIMQSVVKGKLIKLDGPTLKEAAGLSGDESSKPQPFNFGDFEEMTTFRDCVDLNGEKKISLHASNKIEKSSLHHMGMLKQEDKWVFNGDVPPTPEPVTDEDGVPSHDEDQLPQVEIEPEREQESEPKAFSPFEQIMINKLDAVMEMSRRHESIYSGILDRFDNLDHEINRIKAQLRIPEDSE
uniref:Uncharacterized protein n=1 Tax=Cajanus cajan TaxID=3821 RepID=A0A151QPR9_CAJCA|nr:hypothetical protein KK1_047050 [Cajanus cajan]